MNLHIIVQFQPNWKDGIINFHLKNLEKLAECLNIFDLIDIKLTLLKDEIDYSSDIDNHELQNDASILFER